MSKPLLTLRNQTRYNSAGDGTSLSGVSFTGKMQSALHRQVLRKQGCSIPSIVARPSPAKTYRGRKTTVSVVNRAGGSAPVVDRVIAALPYLLPFFNAWVYGRFLFVKYSALRQAVAPFAAGVGLYHSIPFAPLAAFFAIYLAVVNNRQLSSFVRFNAMQAVLLDILLVLPRLVESLITPPLTGWGAQLYVYSQSFVWIFTTCWVVYAVFHCIMGMTARIPYVGDAASAQIR